MSFADLKVRPVPPVPTFWAALGPGIVWMALAQGSGELYFWPYFAAKYGALYLCLLIPACVLQTPINLEIGRYTLVTGESVFVGFTRLGRTFGFLLWMGFALNFIFIGGWVKAGGTALAGIVEWPAGWEPPARTLLWTYVMTGIFATALFVGRVVYKLIERVLVVVAAVTSLGLVVASLHPAALERAPAFLRAVFLPSAVPAPPADLRELENFVTMICYSGLGGFWSLFYSYWLREKGYGMAAYAGRITSPITGKEEVVSLEGHRFEDTEENRSRFGGWMRRLFADNAVGVLGNLFTTLLMAFLAFALLHPKGIWPREWDLAAKQAEIFGSLWGPAARMLFLVVSGLFLADSWLAGADAVSRVHGEMTCAYSARARAKGVRFWYYVFLGLIVVLTCAVLPGQPPGDILALTGVMSLFAVPVFSTALWLLNYVHLPRAYPGWVRGGRLQQALLLTVILFYVAAAVYYLCVRIRMRA